MGFDEICLKTSCTILSQTDRQTDRWLHDLLARAKSSTITHGTSLQIMLNLISTPHKNASIPSTAMRLNTNLNYQFNINSFKFTHKTIINSSSLVFCCFQQVSHMHSHLLSCLNLDLPETKSFNCPQSLPSYHALTPSFSHHE